MKVWSRTKISGNHKTEYKQNEGGTEAELQCALITARIQDF